MIAKVLMWLTPFLSFLGFKQPDYSALLIVIIIILLAVVVSYIAARRTVYIRTIKVKVAEGYLTEKEIVEIAERQSQLAGWAGPALVLLLGFAIILLFN